MANDEPARFPSGGLGPGILAVFLLALAIRATYLAVATANGALGGLFLDSRLFADSAAAVRSGTAGPLGAAPYLTSPLYPLFLALFPSVETPGTSALDVRIVQSVLGAVTCALAAALGGRIASRRAGWIAGIVCALYAPSIHFDAQILVASLAALALTAGTLGLLRAWTGTATVRGLALTGLAFGCAAALRPSALLVVPAALVGVALARGLTPGQRARRVGGFAAGCLLAIAPFSVQNVRAGEPLVLTAGAGFNLWVGNHAEADGIFRAPEGYDALWDPVAKSVAERAAGRELGYAEASRVFTAETLADVRARPASAAGRMCRKLWLFLHPFEVPQLGAGFDWHRERAWPLRFPLDARWILLLALAAPLAQRTRTGPALLVLATYALGVMLFFVTARYRAPIMPVAIALAAVTVDRWLAALRHADTRGRTRARWLVAATLLGIVGALGFRSRPEVPTGTLEERHRGVTHYERGEYEEAVAVLSAAVARDPNAKTRIALALALRELGREDDARRELEMALSARPEDPDASFHLGILAWETRRDAGAARALFQRAIGARPGFADAYFNLGAVELASRRFAQAAAAFESALELAGPTTAWRPEAERGLALARAEALRE